MHNYKIETERVRYKHNFKFIYVFVILLVCIPFQVKAQRTLSRSMKITLKKTNITLEEVLGDIERQSKFLFIYDNDVDLKQQVSINVKNETVEGTLNKLFAGKNITYQVKERHILLSSKQKENLLQKKRISGSVKDAKGEAIIGANIVEEGTPANGTVTDLDGNFFLSIAPDASIRISYIGYVEQKLNTIGKTNFHIVLQEDTKALDEVVVVGYGTVRKRDLTGSVSSISPNSFKNQPVTELSQILQGRAPGLSVSNVNGSPNAGAKIRIRGANSINGGNSPLLVVDGVTTSSTPAPNDIESIEVLKDASATAIYGSRGANGVIIITSKKGKWGTPQIEISYNHQYDRVPKKYDLLDAYDYAVYYNKSTGTNYFSEADLSRFKKEGGTDWQDIIFRTGHKNTVQASLSGSLNKSRYYVSTYVSDAKGILINTDSHSYHVRTNVTTEFNKRLHTSLVVTAGKSSNTNGNLSTGGSKDHPIWNSLIFSPTVSIYNEEDKYNRNDPVGSTMLNPYMYAMESRNKPSSYFYAANGDMQYKLFDDLLYSFGFGIHESVSMGQDFTSTYLSSVSSAGKSTSHGSSWEVHHLLNYTKSFRDMHHLSALAGYEESYSSWDGFSARASDLAIESVGYDNLSLGNVHSNSSYWGEGSLRSFFGRINYDYKSRYFFTGTYRADGSSKFRDKNRYGYFPSFALSWDAAQEPFVKNWNIFDQFKVRFSWGQTGNQAVSAYSTLSSLSYTTYGYGTDVQHPGYYPSSPANKDLKWETTTQKDIGIDISIWSGKINLTVDYFVKQTKDLLMPKQLPYYNGGGSTTVNIGEMRNKGFETSLTCYPIEQKDWNWNFSMNFSTVKNKIISLGGDKKIYGSRYAVGTLTSSPFVLIPGESMGTFWGVKFLGVWGTDEIAEAEKFGNKPGDSKYEDVNHDNKITADDYQIIGNGYPTFSWGFNNSVSYKNIGLNILLEGVHGQDVFNLTYATTAAITGDARTITLKEPVENIWSPSNQHSIWPIHSSSNVNYMNSSKWIQNGSFIKLRNVSIWYNIPKKVIKFGEVRLSLSGQNLLTLTRYKGFDPEISSTGHSDTDLSLDFGVYPSPRSITMGISFLF